MQYLPLFVLFLVLQFPAAAQPLLDVRIGAGRTHLVMNSTAITTVEADVNYRFSRHFALSGNVGGGDRKKHDFLAGISFFRSDLNLCWSPFSNRRRHDFRLGGGVSYQLIDSPIRSYVASTNGEVYYAFYENEKDRGVGYSLLAEYTVAVKQRYLIGAKVAAREYTTDDSNVEALLKFGVRL